MMNWLTLDRIKAQCRIEQDFTMEDELLEDYGETAEEVVLNYCARTVEDFIETYGRIPAPVRQASLLLVNHWYEHHSPAESLNLSSVPYGNIDVMLKPYMKLAD